MATPGGCNANAASPVWLHTNHLKMLWFVPIALPICRQHATIKIAILAQMGRFLRISNNPT